MFLWVLGGTVLFGLYTYVGYPLLLKAVSVLRPRPIRRGNPPQWPSVTLTLAAYNEADQIAATIESLLGLDYPVERRRIVIVSDASDDGTDEIVRSYAHRGVELLRLEERGGKTAAENAGARTLTGDLVVSTDASVRLDPGAVKHLVQAFSDPAVGVASGRDVSVIRAGRRGADSNVGESGYVGYEMWVRRLESRVGGIVGASGSIYAVRGGLHRIILPTSLSRDFAAALTAREQGYRAVSVDEAVAYVPRAPSLRREYRRKVRTMARGMETLAYKRALLNPARFGLFSWMLFSHKLCRWLVPWAMLVGLAALAGLSLEHIQAAWLLAVAVAGILTGLTGWAWPEGRRLPRLLAIQAFTVVGTVAAIHAAIQFLRGDHSPTWEPTRRGGERES
jgi:cellulose synthase/poly-beta-1,6-N-acetylglucosamine synthase-like glycosyltransferase